MMQRYLRQINLPQVGTAGQTRLSAAQVLCVGLGGLGSPVALYLAAAGVGTLGLIDGDVIDLSNLQRQVLYRSDEIGDEKIFAAQKHIHAFNPEINVISHSGKLTAANALNIIQHYDLVIDGSDNFTTKYLINDACFHFNKPWVYAGISAFSGQCSVFTFADGPCYRCVYPKKPTHFIPNCAEAGVIGTLPGILGCIQANEALKLILGIGQTLEGRFLTLDALNLHFNEYQVKKNSHCILCQGKSDFHRLHAITPTAINALTFQEIHQQESDIQLIDVREFSEHQTKNLGGINIPLSQLAYSLVSLSPQKFTVVYCHAGPRSVEAARILMKAGFTSVAYLEGGMNIFTQKKM